MENANDSRHYMILVAGIFVGLVGLYLRFVGDAPIYTIMANIIFIIGIVVCLRSVFAIIK